MILLHSPNRICINSPVVKSPPSNSGSVGLIPGWRIEILNDASVQSLSHVQLFVTPWTAACQASLSISDSRVYPNSCPLSQWCHPTISSSVVPFSCPQSFPAWGSFQMSLFFTSGGQSIGASASTSVLPTNTQNWPPLGPPCCPRDSQVSSPTPQFKSINSLALTLQSNSHIHTWPLEKP